MQAIPKRVQWSERASRRVAFFCGAVFLYYGCTKLPVLDETVLAIRMILPNQLAAETIAVLVTAAEIYLGLHLVISRDKTPYIYGLLALLSVFTVFLLYTLIIDNPVGCGCGGLLRLFASIKANAAVGIFRNVMLTLLLLSCLKTSSRKNLSGEPIGGASLPQA